MDHTIIENSFFKNYSIAYSNTSENRGELHMHTSGSNFFCKALESPLKQLSHICNGIRDKELKKLLKQNNTPSQTAFLLFLNLPHFEDLRNSPFGKLVLSQCIQTYLTLDDSLKKINSVKFSRALQKENYLVFDKAKSNEIFQKLKNPPNATERLKKYLGKGIRETNFISFFDDELASLMIGTIQSKGSKGLLMLAKGMRAIEKKTSPLTPEEKDILRAIEEASKRAKNIPTKKAVRELWLDGRKARTPDQFKSSLKRLGFSWLPHAKRGKARH